MRHYQDYTLVNSYWFSVIPSHWEKTKNKFILNLDKNVVGDQWSEFTLLTMGKGGVSVRDLDGSGKYPESFETYQEVKPNHLIFCLFDLDETPRTVGLSKLNGMITSAYDVIKCKDDVEPRFVNYFYQSIDDVKGLKPYYTGLRKVVRADTFLSIDFYLPPLPEQNQISDYLDRKTQQIDNLIEKTERKIELLKEQRSSLINQCVTKGLDPYVEMKDSGVEWIGEIPVGWKITKTKFISTFINGYSFKSDDWKETGIPVIRMSNIGDDGKLKISDKNLRFVDETTFNSARQFLIKRGDVLICMTDMNPKMLWLGSTVIFYKEENYLLNQRVGITRINDDEVDIKYYGYLSNTNVVKDQLKTSVYPNVQTNLSVGPIRNSILPLPPLSKQKQISDHLDRETSKIDRMVDIETKRVELLKEYRQSLISNVVTGKIDVRDEVVQ